MSISLLAQHLQINDHILDESFTESPRQVKPLLIAIPRQSRHPFSVNLTVIQSI